MGLFTSFQLRSRDPETRLKAARSLGVRGKHSAIAPLQTLAGDPDWTVRRAAVESLGVVAETAGVPPLLAAVRSADQITDPDGAAAVRSAVVEALGRIGVAGVQPLLEALKDRHARLRETAILGLGAIGGPEAVSALGRMVDDDRSNVRRAAVSALARAAGAAAVPALARALTHRDPATRRTAAEALGSVRDDAAVEAAGIALADADRTVREAAILALASMATPEAASALIERLTACDRETKGAIADGLRSFEWTPRSAAERVVHATIRGRFDEAVAEGPAAVEPLVAAMADRHADARCGAVAALGRLGDPRAAAAMAALLRDAEARVRDAAADALAALGPATADAVLEALQDRGHTVRAAAARSLSALGEGRVASALAARVSAGRPVQHGGLDLRAVETREQLDTARKAADALAILMRHAAAKVPVEGLHVVAALTDLLLLEPGRAPDRSDRLEAEDLRQAALAELRRRGA